MGVWRHRRQHWWLGKKLAVGICSDDERCANFPCPVLPDPYPNILPNTLRLLRDAKTELKFPSPLNNCVWHIGETVWTNQNSSFFPLRLHLPFWPVGSLNSHQWNPRGPPRNRLDPDASASRHWYSSFVDGRMASMGQTSEGGSLKHYSVLEFSDARRSVGVQADSVFVSPEPPLGCLHLITTYRVLGYL